MARYFVMTDLEGVVGVDSWAQVRATDDAVEQRWHLRDREVTSEWLTL